MPTVKELHKEIREYNSKSCIKGYSGKKKSQLLQMLNRPTVNRPTVNKPTVNRPTVNKPKIKKKKIKPTLVMNPPPLPKGSKPMGPKASHLTKGQKTMKKAIDNIQWKSMQLNGKDKQKGLAFTT